MKCIGTTRYIWQNPGASPGDEQVSLESTHTPREELEEEPPSPHFPPRAPSRDFPWHSGSELILQILPICISDLYIFVYGCAQTWSCFGSARTPQLVNTPCLTAGLSLGPVTPGWPGGGTEPQADAGRGRGQHRRLLPALCKRDSTSWLQGGSWKEEGLEKLLPKALQHDRSSAGLWSQSCSWTVTLMMCQRLKRVEIKNTGAWGEGEGHFKPSGSSLGFWKLLDPYCGLRTNTYLKTRSNFRRPAPRFAV